MPDLLAPVSDLRAFLKIEEDDPDFDNAAAELNLRIASGEVRAATSQLFDLVEDDVVILDGTGTGTLLLPELPVVDVSEVLEAQGTSAEVALAGPDEDLIDYEWSEDGIVRRLRRAPLLEFGPSAPTLLFSTRYRWYKVTYSHGYAFVPDEVAGVVIRVAARAYNNPEGLRQETIGRYSYTIAGENAGIGLTSADLVALAAVCPNVGTVRTRAGTEPAGS